MSSVSLGPYKVPRRYVPVGLTAVDSMLQKKYLVRSRNAYKKGKYFMKCSDRMTILRELRSVDVVVESIDTDRTVRKTIEMVYQNYKKIYGESLDMWLSNGGDVNNDENMPEKEVCDRLGIKLTEKLGEKISSSSWLTGLKARKDVEGSSIANLSHIGI